MKSLVFVVSLLNVAWANSPHVVPFRVRPVTPNSTEVHHRIYGGTQAAQGQFPFMILTLLKIRNSGAFSKCSSSLIGSEWVLVAAHCLTFRGLLPENILLVGQRADLGKYVEDRLFHTSFEDSVDETIWGVQERRAQIFFVHPAYSEETLEHDVGLIRVKKPFVLNNEVKTIDLSGVKMKTKKFCTILGWGLTNWNTDQQKLHFVRGKGVSTTKIGCSYKPSGPFICLQPDGTGICLGDSGSPLVCDDKVWGVASHYISANHESSCGDSLEEYYSELYDDLKWIEDISGIRGVKEGGGGNGGGNVISGTSLKTVLSCLLVSLWLSAKK